MDKNQAARRFMLGWRLRIEPKNGTAAWVSQEGEEPVAYTTAARLVATLAEYLDIVRTEEKIEYFLRDDDTETSE